MTEIETRRAGGAHVQGTSAVRTIVASIVLAFMFAGCSTLHNAPSAPPPNPFDGTHGQ